MRSYMKYNTVIYGFYRAKKGIDFGKSLFVLEGILSKMAKGQTNHLNIPGCLKLSNYEGHWLKLKD